jgi:peroxin-13
MTSPPKPWEGAVVSDAANLITEEPILPSRPPVQATTGMGMMNRMGAGYGNTAGYGGGMGYGNSGYGTGGMYGSTGYGTGGMYGSTGYGTGGMYGSTGYGTGYGGYQSGYGGGVGGMYGGINAPNQMSMYGNSRMRMNMMADPNNPESVSLMQRMEQSTQPTFMMLEQVVQAFGGFAQMLESTFFATHSSFMAMVRSYAFPTIPSKLIFLVLNVNTISMHSLTM